MVNRIVLVIVLFLSLIVKTQAQNGYDWGENKPDAKAQWQYLNFLIDQKNYNQAAQPLRWLLKNTPNLHDDLYALATKVYEKVEDEETNKDYKKALQDTVLMMYDKRIQLFGNEAEVLNRKGLVAYGYLYKRADMADSLFHTYAKIYQLNGVNTYIICAYSYMNAACDKKKMGGMSNDKMLEVYEHVTSVFDTNIKNEKDSKKKDQLEKFKTKVDEKLSQCADLSCDYVVEKWGNSPALEKQKMVYNILLANDCTNRKEFLTLASKIIEAEPSASANRQLGDALLKNGNYKEAVTNYSKAIEQSTDVEYKASLYLKIADIYSSRDKAEARSYAQKAIASGQYTKEAYTLIGNLYVSSYDECKSDNPVLSRALFIAAADKYKKAGNTAKATELKANFPSKEEVFLYQKKVGDKVDTGCWVHETVSIETRD